MYLHLEIITILLLVERNIVWAPPPLHLIVECESKEIDSFDNYVLRPKSTHLKKGHQLDIESFCDLIHSAIPKAVKDGKFMLTESDQASYSDTQVPFAIAPPRSFVPKLGPRIKLPKLKIPKISVPKLRSSLHGPLSTPRVGSPMSFPFVRNSLEEESSGERMERFKKGVQKMLHVVKVLGQVDQYLSERTRIVVDKLSKTFAD